MHRQSSCIQIYKGLLAAGMRSIKDPITNTLLKSLSYTWNIIILHFSLDHHRLF